MKHVLHLKRNYNYGVSRKLQICCALENPNLSHSELLKIDFCTTKSLLK